jgi:hypothetical protein
MYSHNPYIQYASIIHCTVTVPQSYIVTNVTLKFFILAHVKGTFYVHYHLINITLTIQSRESPCIYKQSLFSTMKQSLLNLV